MEIIIAIVVVVIGAALYYNRKPKSTEVAVEEAPAPYKVETPVVDQVTDAVTQKAAPAKKKPAAKKAPAKKPAVTAKTARAKKTTTK